MNFPTTTFLASLALSVGAGGLFYNAINAAPSKPLVPKPMAIEFIRAQRQDADTFRLRWRPTLDLPQPLAYVIVPTPRPRPDEPLSPPLDRPKAGARTPHSKQAPSVPRDICTRHGQHKVFIGRYKWRCKR